MPYMRAAALFLFISCAPGEVVEDAPGLKVFAPERGPTTAAPARVSVFFTVQTAAGEPMPGLVNDAFQISEDGEHVSPLESQQSIRPRGQAYRMDSLLLLDMSGSMLRGGTFPTLREAAGRYVKDVLSQGPGQKVAVMTFDGRAQPTLVMDFSDDALALARALDGLLVVECRAPSDCAAFADRRTCAAFRCVDDSTNLNGAIIAGVDLLEARLAAADGVQFKGAALVAFTDGRDQAARVTDEAARARVSATAVKVITVGMGPEIDADALRALGKNGAFTAPKADELDAAFARAASRVMAEANQSYVLEYCSPRRSGTHRLEITVSAPVNGIMQTGAFTGSFDATGFASGCSL